MFASNVNFDDIRDAVNNPHGLITLSRSLICMEASKPPQHLLHALFTGCAWASAYNTPYFAVAIISKVGYFPEHSQHGE